MMMMGQIKPCFINGFWVWEGKESKSFFEIFCASRSKEYFKETQNIETASGGMPTFFPFFYLSLQDYFQFNFGLKVNN